MNTALAEAGDEKAMLKLTATGEAAVANTRFVRRRFLLRVGGPGKPGNVESTSC